MNNKKNRRFLLNVGIFIVVMLLTFWSVFRKQNLSEIVDAILCMSVPYLAAAIFVAIFFVAAEGCMICYLLKGIGESTTLLRCISYSFIGFLFSGITPSATGGQPMQLYYMGKDGNSLSASSVVLMTVAAIYKFVLVLIGIGLVLFWNQPLKVYLKGYYGLYFLGLFLNTALVVILLLIMFTPEVIKTLLYQVEALLVRLHLWKKSDMRRDKIDRFLCGYQETVCFLRTHKKMIGITIAGTFLQRFSVFVLTYIIYRGLGRNDCAMLDIVFVQACIYIAVDMLPIPGAQGITEAMYKAVFASIFPGQMLVVSMCITRGISFYLMILMGLVIFCLYNKRRSVFQ
ncbi:MAG: YbhN family protein [Lachnospiraceae bacterium]